MRKVLMCHTIALGVHLFRCGTEMKYWSLMFGTAIAMAMLRGVKASEPITPNLPIHAKGIPKQNKRIILIDKN